MIPAASRSMQEPQLTALPDPAARHRALGHRERALRRRRHLIAHPRAVRSADGDLTHVDGDRDDLVVTLTGARPSRGGMMMPSASR
jgi:hypothetical protein